MLAQFLEEYDPATSWYGRMGFVRISREVEPVHRRLPGMPAIQPVPFAYCMFVSCATLKFSICLERKYPPMTCLTRLGHIGVRAYFCMYAEHPASHRLKEVRFVDTSMRFE